MNFNKKFLICGGDLRQLKMAESLAADGFDTAVYGFGNKAEFEGSVTVMHDIKEALEGRDVVILPLPCSSDDETINMPMDDSKLAITDLFKYITRNQVVVAGKVSAKVRKLAELYNIVIMDYFDREELTVLNAIPI